MEMTIEIEFSAKNDIELARISDVIKCLDNDTSSKISESERIEEFKKNLASYPDALKIMNSERFWSDEMFYGFFINFSSDSTNIGADIGGWGCEEFMADFSKILKILGATNISVGTSGSDEDLDMY